MDQGETRNIKVLSSMMVDLRHYVDCNPKDLGITELVYYPVLKQLMDEYPDVEDLKEAIHKNVHDLIPKHITKDDILHPSTITCIWSTASAMMTISIIWQQTYPCGRRTVTEPVPYRSFQTGESGS